MSIVTNGAKSFGPVIEPHTQEWLDELAAAGGPPLYELPRQVLRWVQASVPVELAPAEIDDRVIPVGPTGEGRHPDRPAEQGGRCPADGPPHARRGLDPRRRGHARVPLPRARERRAGGGPKLAAQALFHPVTDADFDTETYREHDPRLRPGQPDRGDAGRAGRNRPGGRRTADGAHDVSASTAPLVLLAPATQDERRPGTVAAHGRLALTPQT